ncbi:hypothetical protein D9757_011906 [Collybiopsis confluens]|uniref:Uncharacterized protein n=1 Tax=Collybiopsis confluens TaxID=2823264 RepID=A0A8H5GGK5_9AGAR|nr:hypothetical protein D9757_011906 [Collybiopsis confluens]
MGKQHRFYSPLKVWTFIITKFQDDRMVTSPFHPYSSAATRVHHERSGHSTPLKQSTNQTHPYIHRRSSIDTPRIAHLPRQPVLAYSAVPDSPLPKQNDLRIHLLHRLREGNFQGGFPLQHTVDSRGRATVSKQYNISLAEFGSKVWIGFQGPNEKHHHHRDSSSPSVSSSQYFTWQVYHRNDSKSHSSRTILAQVRIDPAVMHTSYGKFLRNDARAISRALAISLELGVLVTMVSTDENCNAYAGSSKLAKLVLEQQQQQRRSPSPHLLNPQYHAHRLRDNEAEWDAFGLGLGLGVLGHGFSDTDESVSPYSYSFAHGCGLDNRTYYPAGITRDSILYIGTGNSGSSDLLYTYPRHA